MYLPQFKGLFISGRAPRVRPHKSYNYFFYIKNEILRNGGFVGPVIGFSEITQKQHTKRFSHTHQNLQINFC